jgi:hypothetical protein
LDSEADATSLARFLALSRDRRAAGLFDEIEDKVNDILDKVKSTYNNLNDAVNKAQALPGRLNVLSVMRNQVNNITSMLSSADDALDRLDITKPIRNWKEDADNRLKAFREKAAKVVSDFKEANPKLMRALDTVGDAAGDAVEVLVQFAKAAAGKCDGNAKRRALDFFNAPLDAAGGKRKSLTSVESCILDFVLTRLKAPDLSKVVAKAKNITASRAQASVPNALAPRFVQLEGNELVCEICDFVVNAASGGSSIVLAILSFDDSSATAVSQGSMAKMSGVLSAMVIAAEVVNFKFDC